MAGPQTTDVRLVCLQSTFQHFARSEKMVRAEDVIEYAGKLEEYILHGAKKPSGLTVAQ